MLNTQAITAANLKNITKTSIPLDWTELCKVYDDANSGAEVKKFKPEQAKSEEVTNSSTEDENPVKTENKGSDRVSRRSRTKKESVVESFNDLPEAEETVADVDTGTGAIVGATPEEMKQEEEPQEAEAPKKRTRRTRKERTNE